MAREHTIIILTIVIDRPPGTGMLCNAVQCNAISSGGRFCFVARRYGTSTAVYNIIIMNALGGDPYQRSDRASCDEFLSKRLVECCGLCHASLQKGGDCTLHS